MKKIKGSLKNFEPTILIGAMCVSLCVLLPIRLFQVFKLINPANGFFTDSSFTIPLFYAILAVVAVAFAVLSYLSERSSRLCPGVGRNIPLGVISALTAAAFIYDSVSRIIEVKAIIGEYDAYVYKTMMNYMAKTGGFSLIIESVFAVLSALYLWVFAASCIADKTFVQKFRVLSLSPLFWAIAGIIFRFVRKISFVNVSDLLLELFFFVCLMLFFLAFAQVYSGIESEGMEWRLYGFGLSASLLALLISLPRLLAIVFGKSDILVEQYGFEPCILMLGILIPVLLFGLNVKKAKETGK